MCRYIFNGNQIYGFSLTDSACLGGGAYSNTHEMAHNIGCHHNRENATAVTDYSYGWRYCNGTDP